MQQVAVLFARRDSVYKQFPDCDVYDADRDARTWPGGCAAVYHPPCSQWSIMRHMARKDPEQKKLALLAVERVRKFGGVLEHPLGSLLWSTAGLPSPGAPADEFGGWSYAVSQKWFGHRAEKKTLLYIVGCKPSDLPPLPITLGDAPCVVAQYSGIRGTSRCRPELAKSEREHTPPPICGVAPASRQALPGGES